MMQQYEVVEQFISVNGEGVHAGQLAVFVRFFGCNLACPFCDTKWANEANTPVFLRTEQEIYDFVLQSGIHRVTLTGGEPLRQKGIEHLLERFLQNELLQVEIETNGSVDIRPYQRKNQALTFTMDYKLPSSQMEDQMKPEQFASLQAKDTVKFVIGTEEDLVRAKEIVTKYELLDRCHVYWSPVYGQMPLERIVTFMKQHRFNGITLQAQLHKIIWGAESRGV